MTWARILDAHIANAQGRGAESPAILRGVEPKPDDIGAYQASTAVLAARHEDWEIAIAARERCDTLNRFHLLLQETDALLAEQDRPEVAATLWRQALVDRLSTAHR